MTTQPTAGFVIIGDEILSGRTADANTQSLATRLATVGIPLAEVRIISDDQNAIATAVNALRKTYDYVFTSGGIGPTHDDITCDSIAHAFNTTADYHPTAYATLEQYYTDRGLEFTTPRKRMARTPQGATLIENPMTAAPGFVMENVYTMAGVPSIFNAMVDAVIPTLKQGAITHSITLKTNLPEGAMSEPLEKIAIANPTVSIGSYPTFDLKPDGKTVETKASLVVRGIDKSACESVADQLVHMLQGLNGVAEIVE